MTTIEKWMKKFDAEASPCKVHGARPTYSYEGIHVIECGRGCVMLDGDNANLLLIMARWEMGNDKADSPANPRP